MQKYEELKNAVMEGDAEKACNLVRGLLESVEPLEIINSGMLPGLKEIGDRFGRGEAFLPEMMLSAEAFQEAMKLIEPKLLERGESYEKVGTVVFGTVFSDIHEIGKNIVIILMRIHGFKVIDLGANVPPTAFVEKAQQENADIIAMSALMTTTMTYQKDVIDYLKSLGLRDKYIVLVGGGPVDEKWAEEIGADGTSDTATGAVEIAKELLNAKKGRS